MYFIPLNTLSEMIKTPAIKVRKSLKAAEKQLISRIFQEIIALRSPRGHDENDVAGEHEKVRKSVL